VELRGGGGVFKDYLYYFSSHGFLFWFGFLSLSFLMDKIAVCISFYFSIHLYLTEIKDCKF
ncbi:MAG: hypothetical protein LUG51_17050, partial [Tannerellaceae bacterium]|nr:hypothetical protein [Tannerellaceae bacterium]